MGSPKWFYEISGKWLPWLAVATALLMVVSLVWGLMFAPADYLQGNSYRIIFVHVPFIFFNYIFLVINVLDVLKVIH